MPRIIVELDRPLTVAERGRLARGITIAATEALSVPAGAVRVDFVHRDPELRAWAGVLGTREARGLEPAAISADVTVELVTGRSSAQFAAFASASCDVLSDVVGLSEQAVRTLFREHSLDQVALGGVLRSTTEGDLAEYLDRGPRQLSEPRADGA